VSPAFASVSNAVITVLQTARSGEAVRNFNAAKKLRPLTFGSHPEQLLPRAAARTAKPPTVVRMPSTTRCD
jgi:hypothetical protein